MELETKDQINFDYNTFFYATMCHVCKRFGDDIFLMKCGGCKMISYCGKEHQKQHWAQHKTLCKIIQNVLRDKRMETHSLTMSWEERIKMKQELMQTILSNLKRPLEVYEKQMFQFPRECAICYEQNVKSLVDCRNCAISLCKDHENDIRHKDFCAPLELYLRINLTTLSEGIFVDLHYVQHVTNSKTFQDMKDFMNIYGDIKPWSNISDDILVAEHSEYLTRPLTLFHAMQVLNYVPNREELVIHVIAATFLEEITLSGWELLLHLIETVSLTIIIIGTELKCKSHSLSICDDCLSRGKKVSLEFHSVLYESYVCSPLFVKPDLIVGFNGIGEHKFKTNPEMWKSFIQMLAKQNCPFLVTSYWQHVIEEYINSINVIFDRQVDYLYNDKNPFASLRPFRFIGPEQVFFQNNFMVIYRSLCS